MSEPPAFFEAIRERAAARWAQLEADRELAGPWHQLFRQVQSPRHVLSELLQNADDAGARETSARIENGAFLFEHDGEDFAAEHFASLCRFGYSNKRDLHTIGFRGIGFKSTFSLGDRVEIFTPTLAVGFDRQRFTEPRWLESRVRSDGKTCIRVVIKDEYRRREVERNLEQWQQSPLSLLFFKHIRRLEVAGKEVCWEAIDAGPVPDSEWMALGNGNERQVYLLIRSAAEPFPEESLAEIRQERMLSVDEDAEFPPCKVECVLGAEGRLFVVLPTGVKTALPFACNAPFIQDPARLKIKDPETSPTNRWLLRRAGQLASASMLAWLKQPDRSDVERARAYGFFPDLFPEDRSLDGVCSTIIAQSFEECIGEQPFLLVDDGSLVKSGECVALPESVLDVWPSTQATAFFDKQGRPGLSPYLSEANRQNLCKRGAIEQIDKSRVLATLQAQYPPRPESWHQLLGLWVYIAPEATAYWPPLNASLLHIVPVEGEEVLCAAEEVVRLGEKKLLASEDDWRFMAEHLLVLRPAWPRFLADERRAAEERSDGERRAAINAADAVLKKIGLESSADVSRVMDRAAAEFFTGTDVSVAECVRLAQLAAKLGATAGEHFRYVSRDGKLRSPKESVLFDADGRLEELLPQSVRGALLDLGYLQASSSCTRDEWTAWVRGGRSGLRTFPPLIRKTITVFGRAEIQAELRRRGGTRDPVYHYKTNHFEVVDWDFDEACWRHWKELAKSDGQIWGTIAEHIVAQTESFWSDASRAMVNHVATTGNTRQIVYEPLSPSWVIRLRAVPCLRDTRSHCHKPGDLLRRTPETESLIDVEAFVHASLDSERTRPLLDLLGVRSTPTGPDRLLDCLRALATSEQPPVHEVERWYRRLDQMIDTCSTDNHQKIKDAFRSEKLIFSDKGAWSIVSSVFLSSAEEDVPGAATIRESVANLTLWRKLGVAERPTADLAIQWLKQLPSGQKLSPADLTRVRALLARHPVRVWEECAAWINLAGEWVSTESLSYALTMQSLLPWGHFHEWVKQETADFQRLPVEVTRMAPFSDLPPLTMQVEERLDRDLLIQGEPEAQPWLRALGSELCRIELDSDVETDRVRALALELAITQWQRTPRLETTAYIDGMPASTPRAAGVLWLDRSLYVTDLSKAKLAKLVPEEIAKRFGRQEIKAALDYSFERSPDHVRAYLEENFKLAPAGLVPPEVVPEHGTPPGPAGSGAGAREEIAPNATAAAAAELSSSDGAEAAAPPEAVANLPGEDHAEQEVDGSAPDKLRPQPKPNKPSLIERFAMSHGFRKDDEGRFCRADGSWIGKTTGDRFPWERRDASGHVVRYYWPREHCLDRGPLEIESDRWGLLKNSPELYAILLVDTREEPLEVTGRGLLALMDQQKLKLYPASYRLVLETETSA